MLEHIINPFYPPIEERVPLPILYTPGALLLLAVGYAIGPGLIQTTVISSLLVLLFLLRPYYAIGNAVHDYGLSGWFIVFLLLFLDFSSTNPRWTGRTDGFSSRRDGKDIPQSDLKTKTWPQRFVWGLRLATTLRGIGWDWQVKGVPAHLDPDASRLQFVRRRILDLVGHFTVKSIALYVIGLCETVQQAMPSSSLWSGWLAEVIENSAAAIWAWNTVGFAYAIISATAVLLGISEAWEWPPMLNSVATATSVRRTWSVAYHQLLRRAVQRPGIRLARSLGFRKGSIPSRYIQLYLAFYISFVIHWWQQYVITRGGKGEFAFFMMQPVMITIEDSARWIWKTIIRPKQREGLSWLESTIGYVWTFASFAFTLTPFVKGMVETGIIGGSPDEAMVMTLGRQRGTGYLF
ncbi:hypothetical protein F5Y11DRAFT_113937 [Daldinia sp. FL1419]|nr:hypothetical protein F5Y11DRAFT_113937 [Daldinia sp. FL1419]